MKGLRNFTKTSILLFDYIVDGLLLISPSFVKRKKYTFAFLVHSRSVHDLYRKYPFLKIFSKSMLEKILLYTWPIRVSTVTGLTSLKTKQPLRGIVIGILPTARQLMEHREKALKQILLATKLSEKLGVQIIGLGGLTSSLSKGGLDLLDKTSLNITTGHAYTAFNVTSNLFTIINEWNIDKEKIKVAIVGATGSIGSTSAQLIARFGISNLLLIDVERKAHKFAELEHAIKKLNLNAQISTSHQIRDIKDCDFIITATNTPETLIQADDLKSGAIVIDDAQPSDVADDALEREDVLILEAGVTHTPKVSSNFNFGLKDRFDNFCCMAELLILAANNWTEHYVINKATLELVDEIEKLSKELGFKLADFQNRKEKIAVEKIKNIQAILKSNTIIK